MPTKPVYLDNQATTRVDPRVVEAMLPYFTEIYGNAASTSHSYGWEAKEAVDRARESIAAAIGGSPREIVFTSGATESNNLAIRGVAERHRRRGNHLVTVTTEHRAVFDPIERLGRRGFDVTLLGVEQAGSNRAGWLDPDAVRQSLRDDTLLVSVMLANNEIGVLQPLAEIAAICRERGVLVHCDATQAVGKLPRRRSRLGPRPDELLGAQVLWSQGSRRVVGARAARRRCESRLKSPAAATSTPCAAARSTCRASSDLLTRWSSVWRKCRTSNRALAELRNRLFEGLTSELDGVTLNGPGLDDPRLRLANNLNVSFAYVSGEALLMNMRDVAVSSGSACTSANPEPSHVLRAIGLNDDATRSSLRFGLGRFNAPQEIEFAIEAVSQVVRRLRKLGSVA